MLILSQDIFRFFGEKFCLEENHGDTLNRSPRLEKVTLHTWTIASPPPKGVYEYIAHCLFSLENN